MDRTREYCCHGDCDQGRQCPLRQRRREDPEGRLPPGSGVVIAIPIALLMWAIIVWGLSHVW